MKTASVKELKTELSHRSQKELLELCLKLSKFKKENKELLTYLLFESENEEKFIEEIKQEIDLEFEKINTSNYYFIKKSTRKILRTLKKYIRYSQKKETEVELLIYFCSKLIKFKPSITRNVTLLNLYNRQILAIRKKISTMHEDLQYDYLNELQEIQSVAQN